MAIHPHNKLREYMEWQGKRAERMIQAQAQSNPAYWLGKPAQKQNKRPTQTVAPVVIQQSHQHTPPTNKQRKVSIQKQPKTAPQQNTVAQVQQQVIQPSVSIDPTPVVTPAHLLKVVEEQRDQIRGLEAALTELRATHAQSEEEKRRLAERVLILEGQISILYQVINSIVQAANE